VPRPLGQGRLLGKSPVRGAGVEPASPAWKAGVLPLNEPRVGKRRQRKEGESNPQGSSLGRFRGGCHRQLACPSVPYRRVATQHTRGSRGGSRTPNGPVNSRVRLPVPPPWKSGLQSYSYSQSGRPDSNRRSPGPEPGGLPGFPTPRPSVEGKCPAGVEPALPPWQGGRLPLHHGHTSPSPDCQRNRESTGWDSNPRRRITGAVSSPLDDRCTRTIRVGPEGLEPSPARLRAGCAAANTWVPQERCA
jgi:hypothetical protein